MTVLLLDASVWLASIDRRDVHHAAAVSLVDAAEVRPVAALDLSLYEVAHVAAVRWRDADAATRLVDLVQAAVDTRLVGVDGPLLVEASRLALDAGLSVYDAAYVACARRHGWSLVSTDVRDLVGPGFARMPGAVLTDGP